MKKKSILHSVPFRLFLCLISAFVLSNFLPFEAMQFFYTLSYCLKETLMLVLPGVIFVYLFASIVTLEQKAPLLILIIISMVMASNAIAVLSSLGLGKIFFSMIDFSKYALTTNLKEMKPLFNYPIHQIISTEWALILGLAGGLIANFIGKGKEKSHHWRNLVNKGLNKYFIPLLPLYVFGFILKMDYEGSLKGVVNNLGFLFVIILMSIFFYLTVLFFIASKFKAKKIFIYMRELIPACITGFSTMSSAAAMPLTIQASEKNTKDKRFADLIIPATVNVHLLGDAIGVPIMGMALLLVGGQAVPDFMSYLVFTLSFCVAKFSGTGIPGGGVIVLLPVLQSHMGLSPEMTSLLATLYILQDPIFTASNIMGNGAFALITHNILRKMIAPKKEVKPVIQVEE